jgi:hypothetical protein
MSESEMIKKQILEEYKELTKDCSDCNQYRGKATGIHYKNLYMVFCHNHREQYGKLVDKGYITMKEISKKFSNKKRRIE